MGLWREIRSLLQNRFILCASLVCSFAVAACSMPVVDNNDVERARQSPHLPFKQLATEESHPSFVEAPAPGYPKPETIAAVYKFSTVKDCLVESEQTSDSPDLRLINWDTIKTREELSVCLRRIFVSLEDYEAIKSWLKFHKLTYNGPYPNQISDLPRTKLTDGTPIYTSAFFWRKRLPFKDNAAPPKIVVDSFVIQIWFRQSDEMPISAYPYWITTM